MELEHPRRKTSAVAGWRLARRHFIGEHGETMHEGRYPSARSIRYAARPTWLSDRYVDVGLSESPISRPLAGRIAVMADAARGIGQASFALSRAGADVDGRSPARGRAGGRKGARDQLPDDHGRRYPAPTGECSLTAGNINGTAHLHGHVRSCHEKEAGDDTAFAAQRPDQVTAARRFAPESRSHLARAQQLSYAQVRVRFR
jgi:hypothetical protein